MSNELKNFDWNADEKSSGKQQFSSTVKNATAAMDYEDQFFKEFGRFPDGKWELDDFIEDLQDGYLDDEDEEEEEEVEEYRPKTRKKAKSADPIQNLLEAAEEAEDENIITVSRLKPKKPTPIVLEVKKKSSNFVVKEDTDYNSNRGADMGLSFIPRKII